MISELKHGKIDRSSYCTKGNSFHQNKLWLYWFFFLFWESCINHVVFLLFTLNRVLPSELVFTILDDFCKFHNKFTIEPILYNFFPIFFEFMNFVEQLIKFRKLDVQISLLIEQADKLYHFISWKSNPENCSLNIVQRI